MAKVELYVQAPDFIPPQSASLSAKKTRFANRTGCRALYKINLVERSTLNDFNGKSVSLSDYKNKKNVMVVFNRGFF